MDPLVESLRDHGFLTGDHSLDGLPLAPIVVVFAVVQIVSLVLWATGRSWTVWRRPATLVSLAWLWGIYLGHHGTMSMWGILALMLLALTFAQDGFRTLRAALRPRA